VYIYEVHYAAKRMLSGIIWSHYDIFAEEQMQSGLPNSTRRKTSTRRKFVRESRRAEKEKESPSRFNR